MIDAFQKGIQRGIIFFQQIEADSETKNSFFFLNSALKAKKGFKEESFSSSKLKRIQKQKIAFFLKFCTKSSSIQFDMYP